MVNQEWLGEPSSSFLQHRDLCGVAEPTFDRTGSRKGEERCVHGKVLRNDD